MVGATYLAAITSRYLVGAEGDLGEAISERSQVFLEALETWLGLPVEVRRG